MSLHDNQITRHENIACVITGPRQSSSRRDRRNGHPDCRCVPIQIVALQRILKRTPVAYFIYICRAAKLVVFKSETRKKAVTMLTKRKFLAFASTLVGRKLYAPTHASAAVEEHRGQWFSLPVGAGGFITGHSISSDGTTLVCRSDTYGCYIWNGNAATWEQLRTSTRMPSQDVALGQGSSEPGGYEIQVAPSDPRRVYMVSGFYEGPTLNSFVYVSRDRGISFQRTPGWKPLALGANGPGGKTTNCHMAVDPANPDVVYLGTPNNGLFVTFDAGNTWRQVTTVPLSINAGFSFSIAFDPTSGTTNGNTKRIYVCSDGNGFYLCPDGSGTFAAMSGGPRQVSDAAVSPLDGVLYACARNGGTANLWHCVAGKWAVLSNCNEHAAWSVAPDPHDANRIAVCDQGGKLNLSVDHGARWSGYYGKFETGNRYRTATDIPWLAWTNEAFMSAAMIRFDPARTNVLMFSEGIGFWTASPPNDTSKAWSWTSQSAGIEQLCANYVCSSPGQNPILAAWDRPIFRVEDRNAYPSTHGPNNTFAIQMGWSVDWASADPSTIVAVINWFPPANDESCKSLDGGKSWVLFRSGNPASSSVSGCIGGCIAAADSLTYMWIPRRHGSTPDRSQPYVTVDGGTTWTQTIPPEIPAGGDGGWGNSFLLNRQIVCADRVLRRTFYAYSAVGGFFKYEAGATATEGIWSRQNAKPVPSDEGLVKIRSVPKYAGHIFACSGAVNPANQPYSVFIRSTDGCKTFTNVADVQCVYAFGFGKPASESDYPSVCIAGLYRKKWGIYRSTSSLAAWNARTVEWTKIGDYPLGNYDMVTCVEGDANEFGTVYVGFGGSGWSYYKLSA